MSTSTWTVEGIGDQAGRVALVTGANTGLGLEIARVLAQRGARVLLACRNLDKAARAKAAIEASGGTEVEIVALDLADSASIRAAAEHVLAAEARLDLLCNNAGVMGVDRSTTADGFELQFGTNHLGHFALTLRLLPLVTATAGSRVVTMSSMGHRFGGLDLDDLQFTRRRYDRWRAYSQSKLANLLFTAELDRRLQAAGAPTRALAAHPGGSSTELGHEGTGLTNRVLRPFTAFGQSAAAGAQPFLRAATDPAATGGEFYGPRYLAFGRAVRETPSRAARNAADAGALWRRSEELTGLAFPGAAPT